MSPKKDGNIDYFTPTLCLSFGMTIIWNWTYSFFEDSLVSNIHIQAQTRHGIFSLQFIFILFGFWITFAILFMNTEQALSQMDSFTCFFSILLKYLIFHTYCSQYEKLELSFVLALAPSCRSYGFLLSWKFSFSYSLFVHFLNLRFFHQIILCRKDIEIEWNGDTVSSEDVSSHIEKLFELESKWKADLDETNVIIKVGDVEDVSAAKNICFNFGIDDSKFMRNRSK